MKTKTILLLGLTIGFQASANEISSGTTMCKSMTAWKEYSKAKTHKDERVLNWLMGSACFNLANDTKVKIIEDKGGFSRVRLRTRSAPSAWVLKQNIHS